jgi:hypothetical protein
MVNINRNPLWPVAAFLASIWAGIVTTVLMGAFLAGPIQESESLRPQHYRYQLYGNHYGNRLDVAAMENRIRAHARSLGIPDANLICVLSECRQSQAVRPILYVRTTPAKGQQLWEFTHRAMNQELQRLEVAYPDSNKVHPSITQSNDCSGW